MFKNISKFIDNLNYSHFWNLWKFEKAKKLFLDLSKQISEINLELVKDYRNFYLQISLGVLAIIGAILYNLEKIAKLHNVFLIKCILLGFIGFIFFGFLYLSLTYWLDFFYIRKMQKETNNRINLLTKGILNIQKLSFGKKDADFINKKIKKDFGKIPIWFIGILSILNIGATLSFLVAIICIFILILISNL